jgi:hypothetical protein
MRGQIGDSKTKEPVESVYIYNKNQSENSALSDANGIFSTKAALSDTIVLYRIGYESVHIVCADTTFFNVKMQPVEYSLNEVIVTYEEVDKILRKAIFNLKTRYIEDMTYLWHGYNKSAKNDRIRQESHALFSSMLKKNHAGQKEFLDLRLIHLNHVIDSVQNLAILKHHKWGIELIPMFKMNKKSENYYQYIRKNSENDSLIFISCVPKQTIDKNNLTPIDIIINKSDTVLLYFKSLLTESEGKSREYNKWSLFGAKYKMLSEVWYASVKRKENYYYFDNIYSKLMASFVIFGNEYVLEAENVTMAIPDQEPNNMKNKKKLTGYSNQLFSLKATTTGWFWEKYSKITKEQKTRDGFP